MWVLMLLKSLAVIMLGVRLKKKVIMIGLPISGAKEMTKV